MQTPPSTAPAAPAALSISASAAPELRAGQTVRAVVVDARLDGSVTLRIGNQTLEATSRLPLQSGATLELRVERSGDQLLLRLLAAPRLADQVGDAVRAALPRQGGLPPLLANLATVAAGTEGTRPLAELASRFLERLPELSGTLSGEGLRRAVGDSGLFLEAKLAQAAREGTPPAAGTLERDLKVALLRLLTGLGAAAKGEGTAAKGAPAGTPLTTAQAGAALPPLPHTPPPLRGAPLQPQPPAAATIAALTSLAEASTELTRQAQGALARVQLTQLASVPTDPDTPPQWLLEMPIRNGQAVEMVQMRIESRGAGRARKGGKSWAVNLALDLGELGPVQAKVTLGENGEISTLFWSEREKTTRLIDHHLPLLHKNLHLVGLQPGRLGARRGTPPQEESGGPMNYSLVDMKA